VSLTFGRSPFEPERGSYDTTPLPEQISYAEPWPRRMRALLGSRPSSTAAPA